ncbi:E3 ubiquitin/ISG15 ligase TRIM25 isoform X2 [Boleophthalmus pectinirostris]|uniref:E3 ubiquitin/ISG15 ligase TRIM25 isoform X2 n=1 Tax=Boleophthalmus pectinirostris TaxID=150288 RepID=UPI0024321AD0|nr:E3 ubiquitin/ISG15 ligase TRIM25 isoform X2 [Boleophthalmus pectinirostris]
MVVTLHETRNSCFTSKKSIYTGSRFTSRFRFAFSMAALEDAPFSLLSLEDELSCSICLSPFDCPVTIPCGHNFCQSCLLATWGDSAPFSCPQCRTHFATKPELKKNTVLNNVVATFKVRANNPEPVKLMEAKEEKVTPVVPSTPAVKCDTCMEAQASKTCLTCMASYCDDHLRPHRENPVFRLHQLTDPVDDLTERICSEHHKLMELFCREHSQPICSFCLQQAHKGCTFVSPDEQRNLKETDLRAKLSFLDGKIMKNATVLSQMKNQQFTLKDSATNRKKAVSVEFQQMREMLTLAENEALGVVDRELETGQTKLEGLMKKFNENVDNMSKVKEQIYTLLGQSQTQAFLQATVNLPQAVNFDPYTPRVNLDSKRVLASQAFATALKDYLREIFRQPVEARISMIKQGERPPLMLFPGPSSPVPLLEPGFKKLPRSHSPGPGLTKVPQKKKPPKQNKSSEGSLEHLNRSMDRLDSMTKDKPGARPHVSERKEKPSRPQPPDHNDHTETPLNITTGEKRNELLKYGTVLTLDPKTAHKRILLTDNFTRAVVSDEHINYPDCPERFAVCSQVLASKGFSTGRHYWEIKMTSNNFIGIGLAYDTIDRKGPNSRLGRNKQSWCVEWFNVKLSAWHNSNESVLANPNPKRVGVLLDYEGGTATFYTVADRAYPFHTFVFPFAKPVYPAFWIFSSGSSVSLCKLVP